MDEMLGQQEVRVNSTSAAPPCWVEDHHGYVPLVRFFFFFPEERTFFPSSIFEAGSIYVVVAVLICRPGWPQT